MNYYCLSTNFYALSLHDALPISLVAEVAHRLVQFLPRRLPQRPPRQPLQLRQDRRGRAALVLEPMATLLQPRSEEHTSELQSRGQLVCRLLLEKKNAQLEKLLLC